MFNIIINILILKLKTYIKKLLLFYIIIFIFIYLNQFILYFINQINFNKYQKFTYIRFLYL